MGDKMWYILEVKVRVTPRKGLALVISLEICVSCQCPIQVPLIIAEDDLRISTVGVP